MPLKDVKQAEDYVRKATREKRFVQKIQRMVKDVECGDSSAQNESDKNITQKFGGSKNSNYPSIADCWRWLKGLLHDFINLKKENVRLEVTL